MAAAGLTEADLIGSETEVWPENWDVFQVFMAIQSQWRFGPGGPTGLDYNVLYHKLDRMRLSDEEYQRYEADIQVLERAALSTMNRRDK